MDGEVDDEEEAMMQRVHALGYDDLDEMEDHNVLLQVSLSRSRARALALSLSV